MEQLWIAFHNNKTIDGEEKSKPEVIKLGLDLLDKVEEWVKAGIKVYSCYEAGACGYWYHRELTKCGAVNYVVAPRALENQRRKHQKTDRLDARALLDPFSPV